MSIGPKVTPRMIEALQVLSRAPRDGWTPAAFATQLWGRDKHWSRGNGPWGLGPDASGRHGGRMLNRLRAAGLAHFRHEYGYYTATISQKGRHLLAQQSADPSPSATETAPDQAGSTGTGNQGERDRGSDDG